MKLYVILIFLVITVSNCKTKKNCSDQNNPDCYNYDPCFGKTKTDASFVIEEDLIPIFGMKQHNHGLDWKYFDVGDTISNGFVYFEPIDTNALSYEWHIGSKIYNDMRIYLEADTDVVDQVVPIKLITHKVPITSCFPNDDGYDTISRNMFIVRKEKSILSGRWLGYNIDNPNDTFTVTIEVNPVCCLSPDNKTKTIWVQNLPKGHAGTNYPGKIENEFISYKQCIFNFTSSDLTFKYEHVSFGVHAWLNGNDTITIDYNYSDYDPKTLKYIKYNQKTFIGKRIK